MDQQDISKPRFGRIRPGAVLAASSVTLGALPRRRHNDTTYRQFKGTILLVDDDDLVRGAMRMLLKSHYMVLEAADGLAGLETLYQHMDEIDCVISDIRMPRLNGAEYLAKAAEVTRDIYFIVVTGHKGDVTESRLIGNGGGRLCGFLEKPVNNDELEYQVQKAAELTRTQRDRIRSRVNSARLVQSFESIHQLTQTDDLLASIFTNILQISSVHYAYMATHSGMDSHLQINKGAGRFAEMVGEPVLNNPQLRADEVKLLQKALAEDTAQETDDVMILPLKRVAIVLCGTPTIDPRDRDFIKTYARNAEEALEKAFYYLELLEKKRMEQEFKIASELQTSLLPRQNPNLEDIEVFGMQIPAKEVGGDYYDFISNGSGNLGVCIGDVSGKGMPAGLVMAMARSYLKILIKEALHNHSQSEQGVLRKAITKVNEVLYQDIGNDLRFFTLLVTMWDADRKKLRYAGAGHERIIIHRRETGAIETIKAGGIGLGMIEDIEALIKENELTLFQGDTVVMFTDGVTDCHSAAGELYGFETFLASIQRNADKTLPAFVKALYHDISEFARGVDQYDDITLIAIRRK